MTTIAPFHELRALAEAEARAHYPVYRSVSRWKDDLPEAFDGLALSDRDADIAARVGLLCDLSRPASRDALARLISQRIRVAEGERPHTFALYKRVRHAHGGPEIPGAHDPAREAETLAALRAFLWPAS